MRYGANPFYVHPGGDMTQGLSGLGQVLAENRAANEEKVRQEAQQQRIQMAQQAARQALQSGDPMMVADVAIEYPEVAEMLNKQAGIIDDAKKQDATQFSMALLAAAPEDRVSVYERRIQMLRDQGRDPSHTIQSYQDFVTDPDREIRGIETMFAATNPDAYKSYREATTVKPAETREIKRGDRIVTEQWDGENWVQIAEAERFNPNSGTTVNVNSGPSLTPGQEAVDKQFAKDIYTPYVLGGGASDSNKGIEQLEFATEALTTGKPLTGPLIGMMPDFAANFVNPESVNVREAVEEVVQRNLREVLGAQFTEKEGEKLIARAYNPSQSEEVNRERLTRLLNAIKGAAKAKAEAVSYFEENGTMRGFRGRIPTMSDFEQAVSNNTADAPEGIDPELWQFMTPEQKALWK